ncbi:chemotaxis protein [Candidatus Marinarcus aquaticus]|uniref:Chemotaxis protein n=1 Tax=Candidatus Marinarcus aquaticus TaxID=2044504 RepID=A0A4Q0XQA2_9BACT|nr:cache domain-containing protein [Candidatus Marinarcus aquaticus]RXJ56229.1 chemotaxis protein [Candidatus Marinarcus aquaticus]
MLSNVSIKLKLTILALAAIIIVSLVVAANTIYSIKQLSAENIESFKKEAYAKKEAELKNYVSLAMKTVDSFYQRTSKEKVKLEVQAYLKEQTGFIMSIIEGEYNQYNGKMSTPELKKRIVNIVKATRYGESGYFWINDTDSVIVMHPIKPQLDGKDLYNFKDKNGKQIFKEFSDVAKQKGEGYVDYVWPKPGFEKPQDKVSFVKLFKPFNWVVGTGEYVDNVTAKLQEEALKTISEMRYGKDGYFWINDSEPKMIMHPMKPALNGKNLSKSKDPNGKFLFNEMVKVTSANPQGGLVEYMWPKPGKEKPQPKFSYVQKFAQWDWIIGTGEYVDNIEEEILAMENKTQNQIAHIVTLILGITIASIVLLYFIFNYLVKKAIIKPLEELDDGIQFLITHPEERTNGIKKIYDDEIGKIIDSFNGYLENLKRNALQDEKVIAEVEDVISKVNNGFYVYKVHQTSDNPQVKKLRDSINNMIEKTNEKLEEINNILVEYGNSKFDYTVSDKEHHSANGIIGSIATSTSFIGNTVSEFLAMITTSGRKLNSDTGILSQEVNKLATSANEQAASLEQTAAALEQITGNIRQSSENVSRMSSLAHDLTNSATTGESLATKTTQAMEDIDTQVSSINDAITVIDQIAFQTNILSLNAAVEAATAGEAGKGFAVVAQEVRNLASRSAEAAKEIKAIVENATLKANEGKHIANDMISGYEDLNSKIGETIGLISDVSTASKEQEAGIIQINDAINALDRATQVNAASANEISSLTEGVRKLSTDLNAIAQRASFNQNKEKQICDIDLVFKISKIKNDHISFKDVNFAKVGDQNAPAWKVSTCTECHFGQWIDQEEAKGTSFTKSQNWKTMKEFHECVHKKVQEYINENANKASNEKLAEISKEVEVCTAKLFECLDQIKAEYCSSVNKNSNKVVKEVNDVKETKEVKKPTSSASKPQPVTKSEAPVKEQVKKEVVKPSKPEVITSKAKDDDEWESF